MNQKAATAVENKLHQKRAVCECFFGIFKVNRINVRKLRIHAGGSKIGDDFFSRELAPGEEPGLRGIVTTRQEEQRKRELQIRKRVELGLKLQAEEVTDTRGRKVPTPLVGEEFEAVRNSSVGSSNIFAAHSQ